LTDLLPDTKKAYYEQEGRQFIYEQAWIVVRDSPKWRTLSQSRVGPSQESQTPVPTSISLDPTAQADTPNDSQPNATNEGWKRLPGVHTTKWAMKEEQFNAKKIKVLADRASNYHARTLAMRKTNEIRAEIAKAEFVQANMDIMSRNPEDLPNDISREFLRLQKESIIEDLKEQLREKKKKKNIKEDTELGPSDNPASLSSSMPPSELDNFHPSRNADNDVDEGEDDEYTGVAPSLL